MALTLLTIRYQPDGDPYYNDVPTLVRDYTRLTRNYNSATKDVDPDSEDTVTRSATATQPSDFRRATTAQVDQYLVPATAGTPGYDAAAIGKLRSVYHDGNGGLSYTDAAGCDLAIVSVSTTPTTSAGSATGTITVQVSSSAARRVRLDGGPWQALTGPDYTFSGLLSKADYLVEAQDDNPAGCLVSQQVAVGAFARAGCRVPGALNYDPTATEDGVVCTYAPVQEAAIFSVPAPNSLRFVVPPVAFGVNGPFPTRDNTLLRNQQQPGVPQADYEQKVVKADTLTIQFKSNFSSHFVQLRRLDNGAVVRSFGVVRIVTGQGNTATFSGFLRAGDVAGQARVYFAAAVLPLPFLPGNQLTIAGTSTALDATYPVVTVREDAVEGAPYLVINAPYSATTTAQRLDVSISTTYDVQAFDTYQTSLSFSGGIASGCYEVVITATDPELGSARAISEPIDLQADHRDTLLLTYRNFDNAFGLNYAHGLENRLRVVGRLRDEPVTTDKQTLVESSTRTTLLSASPRRRSHLEVFQLPDYMHEKLALAFAHDLVRVQGVEVVLEGEWEPNPLPLYRLWNGAGVLTQREWLGTGNSDDLGDLNQGQGFITANEGFIRI